MLAAAIAQLRLAVSLVSGRPVPLWALDRLIAAGRDTIHEFGQVGPDGGQSLAGPALDDDTRRQVQLQRFRQQARRAAAGTSFYASLLDGIDPGRLTWDDILLIPVTGKDALREHPDAFVHRDARPVLRSLTTGTTGRPTQVSFSERELESMGRFAALGHLMSGAIRPGDVVLMVTSSRAVLGNHSLSAACAKIGALLQPAGIVEPDLVLDLLTRRLEGPGRAGRATGLSTYASCLGELVERALSRGMNEADFGVRWISVGGEVVSPGLLRRARQVFGASVRVDTGYAMTETYPFAGMPCEQGHLHFEPSRGLVEVIDPESGTTCEPGQAGTLVVTPFGPYRETTLLLRYDTEDVVRQLDSPPECSLRHLPATSGLLGKLRLSVRHDRGWTWPAQVITALEEIDDVPLPARFGLRPVAGGVGVDVVVRVDSDATRDRIAAELRRSGVPLTSLRLVADPRDLRNPFPLRCDLREPHFQPAAPLVMEMTA